MDVSAVGSAAQATEALGKGPTQQTQPVPSPEPSESVSVEISDDAKALAASSLADK